MGDLAARLVKEDGFPFEPRLFLNDLVPSSTTGGVVLWRGRNVWGGTLFSDGEGVGVFFFFLFYD